MTVILYRGKLMAILSAEHSHNGSLTYPVQIALRDYSPHYRFNHT